MEYNKDKQEREYNPDFGTVVWAENTSGYALHGESYPSESPENRKTEEKSASGFLENRVMEEVRFNFIGIPFYFY